MFSEKNVIFWNQRIRQRTKVWIVEGFLVGLASFGQSCLISDPLKGSKFNNGMHYPCRQDNIINTIAYIYFQS